MAPAARKRSAVAAATVAAAVMTALPTAARAGPIVRGMDLCTSYSRVCADIISEMDCRSKFDGQQPKPILSVQSCAAHSYDTYIGHCKCGLLDMSNIVLQELVDYSITLAMPALVQPSKTVENATDYGATYTKACATFLSGAKCPAGLQNVAGYGAKGGFSDFRGDCGCGTVDAGDAIRDTVNAHLLNKKLTTTATNLPLAADAPAGTTPNLDVCTTFDAACGTFLDDIACPAALRANRGCTTPNAPDTLVGSCRCGAMDASESLKATLLGLALPGAAVQAATVYTKESLAAASSSSSASQAATVAPSVEYCGTYKNVCTAFLTKAGIAAELQEADPNCVGGEGTNIGTFRGRCAAGTLDVSAAVNGFLVGKSVEQEVPELVCLGSECASVRMNAGVLAIVVTCGVLAGLLLLLFACQRGDAWARACLANPLINILLMPCACLTRRSRAKESPQVTDHAVHLKGMMA